MRQRLREHTRLLRREEGFALVEVIVSAVLLVILATATLSVMEHSGEAAAGSRARASAVSFAQADQDAMRQTPVETLTSRHVSYPMTSDGVTFTVTSDAVWLRDASGVVSCASGTTRAEYLKITSSVVWPGHPAPVVLESYISPGVPALQNGALTVRLKSDAGVGTGGIGVAASQGGVGASGTTDTNGCVVLGNLTPGSNTATWSSPGFVDRNGVQSVSETVSVVTSATAQLERLYDRGSTATANFVDEASASTAAKWLSISATNPGIQVPSNQTRTFKSLDTSGNNIFATSTVATSLFPFVAPYSFYAGNCTGNSPTTWLGSSALPTAVVPAGTTSTAVNVKLPRVTVLGGTTAAPVGNLTLTIKPAPTSTAPEMAGCTEMISRTSGISGTPIKTDPTVGPTTLGRASFYLPYGRWTVCADNGSDRTNIVTLNATPTGTTGTAARSTVPLSGVTGPNVATGAIVTTTNQVCPQ